MSDFIGGISTSFTIEDRATSALVRISEGLEKVQGALDEAASAAETFSEVRFAGVTRSLGALVDRLDQTTTAAQRLSELRFGNTTRSIRGLTDAVDTLSASADALPSTFESAMNRVVYETDRAATAMRGLQSEMRATSAAAEGIGGGGFGGLGGGRRGGRRGGDEIYPHGKTSYMYTLGGHANINERGVGGGIRGGVSMEALAAGYVGYKSFELGLGYDQALSLAVTQMGVDPSTPEGQTMRKEIAETIKKATTGTTFSQPGVASGMAQLYPMLAAGVSGSPEERSGKLSGLMAEITKFAEFETKYVHQGSMEENSVAAARIAHQMKIYDPGEISKILNKVRVMSAMTETSPTALASTLKYSELAGQIAGADPLETLETTGFLLQTMSGSTPGTGLANLFHEILSGQAPSEAGKATLRHGLNEMQQLRSNFEKALKGETGIGAATEHAAHAPKTDKSVAALTRMGLLDPSTHALKSQFIDPNTGMWEEQKILKQIHDDVEKRGQKARVDLDVGLKQRGSRIAAPFLGEGWDIFQNFQEGRKQAEGISIDKAQGIMASTPLGQIQQAWARMEEFMTKLVTVGDPGASAIDRLGQAAAKAAGALEGWTNWLDTHKMPSFEDYNKSTTGGIMGGGMNSPAGILDDIWKSITGHHLYPVPPGDPSKSEHGMRTAPGAVNPGTLNVDPRTGVPDLLHKSSAQGSSGVNVHIQNISFGAGTPRDHAHQFAHELSVALSDAMLNDLGTGYGHQQSSYSTGRTVSI